MAKKRHAEEQELPFVALMDTMTNVVGVLTIVMVMIGIGLARAANRVFSALPPATAEQVRAAQADLDRLRAAQAPLLETLKALAKPELTPAQLAALDAELARLERQMKEKGVKLPDLDAQQRELARLEAELKQKKIEVDKMLAERDRLKALLDQTPVVEAPPAKIVRLPVSRPIPEGSKVERFIVSKEGVFWLNTAAARAAFLDEFKGSFIRQAVHSRTKQGKNETVVYDYEKLIRYFERRNLMYRDFRLEVVFYDWSSSPIMRIIPPATISRTAWQSALQRLKSIPKTVVMFRVTAEGFENYLAAREICDKIGVPAGWEFAGSSVAEEHMYEIQTTHPRVPPKPAAKPAFVGPEIKSPAAKLD